MFRVAVAEAKRKYGDMFRKCGLEIRRQLYNSQRNRVRKLALKCQAKKVRRKFMSVTTPKSCFGRLTRSPKLMLITPLLLIPMIKFWLRLSLNSLWKRLTKSLVNLMADHVTSTPPVFDESVCLSSDEVTKLRKVKCSELDILPTEAFRSIWPDIIPYVTTLLNLSVTQATFPSKIKMSHHQATTENCDNGLLAC